MPKYRFTDIAINSTEKKKPVEEDKDTYIGLEHLDSGTLTVSRWGSDVAPIGEKLLMKKGDVLFGKRRAYQKKVGIAPFDGIFSAHGMVLRPKENVITKEYFPLFISSDYFLDEAIRISVGSLSPTVNWKDLKDLEFTIPTIEEQKKITPVIWSAIEAKNAYKQLIETTDNLVKSQFIEMFGDLTENTKGYELKPLSEILLIERGGSPRPISDYITEAENGVNWIKIGDADEGSIYITHTKEKIKHEGTKKSRYVQPGDFLLSNSMSFGRPYILTIDGYIHDGWLVLRDEHERFDKMFLYALLSSSYAASMFESMAAGSVVKNLNKELVGRLLVPIPPIDEQKQYADFLQQSDKSKFAAQIISNRNLSRCLALLMMKAYFHESNGKMFFI